MSLTSVQRELYYEDGGATVRRLLKEGGEDILPLTEWVISAPYVKTHDVAEVWKVQKCSVIHRHRADLTSYVKNVMCSGGSTPITGGPKTLMSSFVHLSQVQPTAMTLRSTGGA